MMKMSKKRALKIYISLLVTNCGFRLDDAIENAKEKVVSGTQIDENKFLIKIRDDIGFGTFCYEFISPNEYKSLVKRKNKFFQWTDSRETYGKKEVSIN